jgi:OmpA-OmpF porin, OOP family
MLLRNLLLIALTVVLTFPVFAQKVEERPGPDENNIPANRMEQYDKWLNKEYSFPPKERNMWQVGINTGALYIIGDIKAEWGYAVGIDVRKSLGYTVSVRGRFMMGNAFGLDNTPTSGIAFNAAVNGISNPSTNYYNEPGFAYLNNRTNIKDFGLDLLININNLRFHKENNFFAPYVFFGVGGMAYNTTSDQLDANGNKYDYVKVANSGEKQVQRKHLKGMMDRNYETNSQTGSGVFNLGENSGNITFSTGLGFGFKLNKRIEVGLEHRISLAFDDLLDGQKWTSIQTVEGVKPIESSNTDFYNYTNFKLAFNIGKHAAEPDWYVNPMAQTYDYLAYLDNKTDFSDDDDDGVPNLWDRELDSPEGAIVDTKGVTRDSDGDGCPDHEDPEPFSSPTFEIVECVTQWPQSISEARVIELIKENSIDAWFLPSIHFETNKSKILAEFYDNMQYVGDMMNRYKNMKLDVIGHTDLRSSEEYNLGLSQRRAEAAVNFLVENYGISKSRFNIKYKGESEELMQGGKTEKEMYMNRRVEFKVAN